MLEALNGWWETLNFDLQVFYSIAIIALIALCFQSALTLIFGLDDFDGVNVGDHDSGISIFSVRGITAFFTGFGWTGVICTKQGLSLPITILIALVVGGGLMVFIYLLMRSFMRLQSNGVLVYKNAVGQLATVYVTVQPKQQASGQVEIMIQGRLVTAEALYRGSEPIKPGTKVKVIDCIGSSTLVVDLID